MLNVYLFIELLGDASSATVVSRLQALEIAPCKFANVVALSDEKLVAQLDCETPDDAHRVVIKNIAAVDGVVQTNIISVVRPKKK